MTKFIKLQKEYNSRIADRNVDDAKYEIYIPHMNGYMHFLKFQTTDVPVRNCVSFLLEGCSGVGQGA